MRRWFYYWYADSFIPFCGKLDDFFDSFDSGKVFKRWIPAIIFASCCAAGILINTKMSLNIISVVMSSMFILFWMLYLDKTN